MSAISEHERGASIRSGRSDSGDLLDHMDRCTAVERLVTFHRISQRCIETQVRFKACVCIEANIYTSGLRGEAVIWFYSPENASRELNEIAV